MDWTACPACGLTHSARPDGRCPTCGAVVAFAESTDLQTETVRPAALPECAPAPPLPERRVWTVFVAYTIMMVASSIMAVVVTLAVAGPGLPVQKAIDSSEGFLGAAFATTSVLLAVALCAAGLSREPLDRRLALGGATIGKAAQAIAAAGCVAISSAFEAALGVGGLEPTGSLALFGRVVGGLPPAVFVLALATVGIAASFAEELFFRGYVQTRLCRRWGTWTGILVTAALFGFIHLDAVHSPLAFLIGLYLGWLAARAGSIGPAFAAHAFNNLLALLFAWTGVGAHLSRGANASLLVVCGVSGVAAVAWLRRHLAAPVSTASAVPASQPSDGGREYAS